MNESIAHLARRLRASISMQSVRQRYELLRHLRYDATRYVRHSGLCGCRSKAVLAAMITARYHSLEKGLSMPSPRLGFAEGVVKALVSLLSEYRERKYCMEDSQVQGAVEVLREYVSFHERSGIELGHLKAFVGEFSRSSNGVGGGTVEVRREHWLREASGDFRSVVLSRRSVRSFESVEVEMAQIEECVELALRSPSVCNRQCARVYAIRHNELISETLALQGGTRSFTGRIGMLLVVAADLSVFVGAWERQQAYIDGGLFAMSLLYALHYKHLGACCLHWSVAKEKDVKVRQLLHIRNCDAVVCLIAVGGLPERFKTAFSQRRKVEEILFFR